jgi:carboxypeptidase Q
MNRLLPVLVLTGTLLAQDREPVDLAVISRIKTEAFDHSRVMDTLGYLTDVNGPRLTASPGFKQAADWAVKRLQGYGVQNVQQEKWGSFGRSWALKQYSIEEVEPGYANLDAAPLAWSESTPGTVSGEIVAAPFGSGRQTQDPKRLEEDLNKYMSEWKGKLKGRVVMLTPLTALRPATAPTFARYSDKELSDLTIAPAPTALMFEVPEIKDLKIPDDPDAAREYQAGLPSWVRDELGKRRNEVTAKRVKFLKDEGVVAVLTTGGTSHDGLVFAQAAGPYDAKNELAPPSFIVTSEQYNRMLRQLDKKIPVRVRVNLQADSSKGNEDGFNITGELPGGAKKDELVMIGAHFDSWHSGTGATDNAAGSAVMIEVMRILKALNLKLDRTVRIALWSGEEQGLLGSKGYVKEHFGDPDTMKLTNAHEKFAGYFNLDNGSGKIRGVYLQGNDQMRPVFERWLAPFRDQGVMTISIRNTGGTDHLSFDAVGLPGFQFIQDPLEYSTLTHHSNMDTLDHTQPADLMQAAAVIASVVYDAANRPERLPRKELPQVKPAAK